MGEHPEEVGARVDARPAQVLAKRYETHFGGKTVLIGKPHQAIYDRALKALALGGVTDPSRIAAVGDSMLHDVAGATAAAVDSIFVAGGIHAADLGLDQGQHQHVDATTLETFLSTFPDRPTHAVPGFTLAAGPGAK